MILEDVSICDEQPVPMSELPESKLDECIRFYFAPPSDPNQIIKKVMENPSLITNPNAQSLSSDNVYKLIAEKMRRLQNDCIPEIASTLEPNKHYWITKDGTIKLIFQMDDSHLKNTINFLQRMYDDKIKNIQNSIEDMQSLLETSKINYLKTKLKELEDADPNAIDSRYSILIEEHNSRILNPEDYILLKNGNVVKKKKPVLSPNQRLTWCRDCLKGVMAFYKNGKLINVINKDGMEHYLVCSEYEKTGYELDDSDWDEDPNADLWDWKGGISKREMKNA